MSDLKPAGSGSGAPVPGTVTEPKEAAAAVAQETAAAHAVDQVSQPKAPVRLANQFHGNGTGSSPAVLDLRSKQGASGSVPKPNKPVIVEPPVKPVPSVAINPPAAAVANVAAPAPAPATPVSSTHPLIDKPHEVLGTQPTPQPVIQAAAAPSPIANFAAAAPASTPVPTAPAATPSPVIATPKVSAPIAKPNPTTITPSAPVAPSTTITQTPTSPMIARFPQNPALAQPTPTSNPLPAPVATQIDAMKNMVASEGSTEPKSEALRQVLATAKPKKAPGIMKLGAALATITLMGGIVWSQNSPKLAFRSAASKAGIDATLPTYVPSSYQQAGQAQVSSGQLTLNFTSPGNDSPLSISQKRTNWDSNSLRENFVSRQSDNFLAIQGQGLTIFVDNGRADWVNHGIWYSISGASKLSREQVLKIAYGL